MLCKKRPVHIQGWSMQILSPGSPWKHPPRGHNEPVWCLTGQGLPTTDPAPAGPILTAAMAKPPDSHGGSQNSQGLCQQGRKEALGLFLSFRNVNRGNRAAGPQSSATVCVALLCHLTSQPQFTHRNPSNITKSSFVCPLRLPIVLPVMNSNQTEKSAVQKV